MLMITSAKMCIRSTKCPRTLARLLQEARKIIPLITLDRLIHPSNFDLVVESTKKLCRMEEGENLNFGTKVGHLLGHISMIKT
jgi:hypothetical protein